MPVIFGISLIGLIHMLLGTVLVLFVLVKYLLRPKKKKTAGYLIRDVHVIVGDGSELFHQNSFKKSAVNPLKTLLCPLLTAADTRLCPG